MRPRRGSAPSPGTTRAATCTGSTPRPRRRTCPRTKGRQSGSVELWGRGGPKKKNIFGDARRRRLARPGFSGRRSSGPPRPRAGTSRDSLSLSPGVDEGEKNSLAGGAFGQSKLLPFPFSEFPNLHADSVFGSSGTDIRAKKCIRLSTFSPAAESYSLIHLLFVSFIF